MESLSGEETLKAKMTSEQFAATHGVNICHYHCDNGRFAEKPFTEACKLANQGITFCAAGAHHQNGVAERRIHDLTESARTTMLHAIHWWPQAINSHLWPLALKKAVNIRNSLPRSLGQDNPLSLFSSTSIVPNLKHFHPFGCPVYVLDQALQSPGAKFPKWQERARVGIYLCHSSQHASSVALVLNTQTGLVSPQFHLVYDDNFDTVAKDAKFQSLWQHKAKLQLDDINSSRASQQPPTSGIPVSHPRILK